MMPAAGHSSPYMPRAASGDSSRNGEPGSSSVLHAVAGQQLAAALVALAGPVPGRPSAPIAAAPAGPATSSRWAASLRPNSSRRWDPRRCREQGTPAPGRRSGDGIARHVSGRVRPGIASLDVTARPAAGTDISLEDRVRTSLCPRTAAPAGLIMAGSGETVTFGEYEARCNQVAHLLRAAGLQRGDHLSMFMENNPRMLEIEGGAERIGLYYTLVNAYLAPDEVAYIVNNSRSRVFFSFVAKRDVAEAAAGACPGVERLLMAGLDAPQPGVGSRTRTPSAGWPADPYPTRRLGAAMLYSSGTTGQPKGILRPLPDVAPASLCPSWRS